MRLVYFCIYNNNIFMENNKKEGRYKRLYEQLQELLTKTDDVIARMATVAAVLKNKMDAFFWCGFYFLYEDKMVVGPYQGSVACQILQGGGVCLTAARENKTVVVADVHAFPGHIACDSRSNSEIVVPVRDKKGVLKAVLDVDSLSFGSFDETDKIYLGKIVELIYV